MPAMATYRLAEILKSRSGLSDDEIQDMTEDEAWQRLRAGMSMREPAHAGLFLMKREQSSDNRDWLPASELSSA